jgi:hypothetical protein
MIHINNENFNKILQQKTSISNLFSYYCNEWDDESCRAIEFLELTYDMIKFVRDYNIPKGFDESILDVLEKYYLLNFYANDANIKLNSSLFKYMSS